MKGIEQTCHYEELARSEVFGASTVLDGRKFQGVRPAGFEPAAHGLEVHRSIQTELRALV